MTTKTQSKPKTKAKIKKPASGAKTKKGSATKRIAQSQLATTKPTTKLTIIRELVERPDGASITELTKATKWQAHSVRAAITGLRNAGSVVVCAKTADGVARYHIGGGQ
jgi:hypothetical protein